MEEHIIRRTRRIECDSVLVSWAEREETPQGGLVMEKNGRRGVAGRKNRVSTKRIDEGWMHFRRWKVEGVNP